MSSLDNLKQELINQKQAIISKGGQVSVDNLNPSPSEITAGINSIDVGADLSLGSATVTDVLAGKTFYAGSSTLKTGILDLEAENIYINYFHKERRETTSAFEYHMPTDMDTIPSYKFYNNYNDIDFYFSPNVVEVCTNAFNGAKNFRFMNFSTLQRVKTLGDYSFCNCTRGSVPCSVLPQSCTTIGQRVFYNSVEAGTNIEISNSVTSLGAFAYASSEYIQYGTFTISVDSPLKIFNQSLFHYVSFNTDLVTPSKVTQFSSSFNYGGSFNSVTFPSGLVRIEGQAFYALTTDPLSHFHCSKFVFTTTNVPILGSTAFASQHFDNGCRIYVPDASVDAYKAGVNWRNYASYILPVSQMP